MLANTSVTCLVTHVVGSEQTEVWFGSMFRVTILKVVKLGAVCECIVAVLSRKSEDVNVVRSAGTFRGVREKEPCATAKEDVDNRPEWSSTNKVFCDNCLVIAVIHMGGERCRGCMLAKVQPMCIIEIQELTVILDVTTRPV